MARATDNDIPQAALVLGLGGLIPFGVLAAGVLTGWVFGAGPSLYALQIYAAVILSFMGGAQWGMAVGSSSADWQRYGVSVVPTFVAWAGVWFSGAKGLWIMAAGFAALLAYDAWTVSVGEAPSWYGRLRVLLTAVVVACLVATAIFGPF